MYDIYYTDRYKREKRFNALVNNIVFAIVASSLNSYQLTQHTPTARMNLKEMLPLLVGIKYSSSAFEPVSQQHPIFGFFLVTRLRSASQLVLSLAPRPPLVQQRILQIRPQLASTLVLRSTSTLAATTSPSSWMFSTGRSAVRRSKLCSDLDSTFQLPPALRCRNASFGPWTTGTRSTGASQKPAMPDMDLMKAISVVYADALDEKLNLKC